MPLIICLNEKWNDKLPDMTDIIITSKKEKINPIEIMLGNDYTISNRDFIVAYSAIMSTLKRMR